jgi:hypothetical protein
VLGGEGLEEEKGDEQGKDQPDRFLSGNRLSHGYDVFLNFQCANLKVLGLSLQGFET